MDDQPGQTKQELLTALRDEFERWDKLLNRLSDNQILARELPSGLSVKDVVAHLMAWQSLSIARLQAALDNRDPEYELGPDGLDPDADENIEHINTWIHETYMSTPWSEVYRDWRSGFQRFLDLGVSLSEEALMQPARYPWLKDSPLSAVLASSYEHHHEEHYRPLRRWLWDKSIRIYD